MGKVISFSIGAFYLVTNVQYLSCLVIRRRSFHVCSYGLRCVFGRRFHLLDTRRRDTPLEMIGEHVSRA